MPKLPTKTADTFRVLHTADWHLGKQLNDQSREEEHDHFLQWLLETTKEEKIDTILVSGDIFDVGYPAESARKKYLNFIDQLYRETQATLLILGGNHDAPSQLETTKALVSNLNTHVVGALEESVADRILLLPDSENPQVAIAMIPYLWDRDLRTGIAGETAEEIRQNIAQGIQHIYQETADYLEKKYPTLHKIATGHLTVAGSAVSDSEREIHIGGLESITPETFPKAFDYVALGHLHRPQFVDEKERIHYSGSPIPLSFSEAKDKKQVRVLDLKGVKEKKIEQHRLVIPQIRNLVQLKVHREELEEKIASFQPETYQLPTWVELVIDGANFEQDINQLVRELTEGKEYEVLKILRSDAKSLASMSIGEESDEEAIGTLLDHPMQVFEHLLEANTELEEKEISELKSAYQTLIELEQQGGSDED